MTSLLALLAIAAAPQSGHDTWRIQGDLSEACTCSVPCPCNFDQGPGPHSFCWAVFSIDIRHGHFNKVKLDGLHLAGANGEKGGVWYVDDQADARQAAALESIARQIMVKFTKANGVADPAQAPPEMKVLGIRKAHIDQHADAKSNSLHISGVGGFDADYLMGLDGKSPIVVENNASWNITHGIKAKTRKLTYKDDYGNAFDMSETNSNQGKVDWSDQTPVYFK